MVLPKSQRNKQSGKMFTIREFQCGNKHNIETSQIPCLVHWSSKDNEIGMGKEASDSHKFSSKKKEIVENWKAGKGIMGERGKKKLPSNYSPMFYI